MEAWEGTKIRLTIGTQENVADFWDVSRSAIIAMGEEIVERDIYLKTLRDIRWSAKQVIMSTAKLMVASMLATMRF